MPKNSNQLIQGFSSLSNYLGREKTTEEQTDIMQLILMVNKVDLKDLKVFMGS